MIHDSMIICSAYKGAQSTKEETQSAPPESKVNYRSLVSLEDMPDLFASFDSELILHVSILYEE
jgi:hypothetical protein